MASRRVHTGVHRDQVEIERNFLAPVAYSCVGLSIWLSPRVYVCTCVRVLVHVLPPPPLLALHKLSRMGCGGSVLNVVGNHAKQSLHH